MTKHKHPDLSATTGIVAMLSIVALVSICMLVLGLPTRISLLMCLVWTSLIALYLGHTAQEVEGYILKGIRGSAFIIAILLVIGCVIGAWITSGIIPTIIFYGLGTLTPTLFLVGGLVSCSLVSYFTGSSYACMGTIGVALMGIGQGLGLPLPLVAGMVLSGAMFGDKMSPFSDTTNLAAAASNVSLFAHIRSMMYTTIPAWLICAGAFLFLGLTYSETALDVGRIEALQSVITKHFTISPFFLLVPFITIVLAMRNVPPIIAMFFGALGGIVVALVFQSDFGVKTIMTSLAKGLDYDFGTDEANSLFANRGGLASMLYAVSIAVFALIFGELLVKTGIIVSVIKALGNAIFNTASLVIASIASCLMTTMLTGSQYLSIVMPGQALQPLYKKRKVSRRVLSRSLEDGGTMFSTLVPWSADAAFVVGTLGVATSAYLPYAFFQILCPLLSILYAVIGFAVWSDDGSDDEVEIEPVVSST